MSDDSVDTDDDGQIKEILEAADTTLLSNSMFQHKMVKNEVQPDTIALKKSLPKSQRYILEDNENSWTDFYLPESTQKYLAKKLSEILRKTYEFCDVSTDIADELKTKHRNRVKLLKGIDCYVKPYEEFEYDTKGPEKKPILKRRIVDDATDHNNKDAFKLVVVDGNFVSSCQEVRTWANKKARKDKMFHYKMASTGICHAVEDTNEFTELRLKNKWNESRIKNFKMSSNRKP